MKTKEQTENRVALFARESTTVTVRSTSNEQQIQCLNAHCDEHGLSVVRTYREVGSGLDNERPVFDQLLCDIARDEFKALLCCSVDRLSRSVEGLGKLIQVSEETGVTIIPVCTPDAGPLQTLISMFVSNDDRRVLSQRAKMGRIEAAKRGRFPGGRVPYGYVLDSDRRVQVDQYTSIVVRRIYDLYVNHRLGALRIASQLNEDGIESPGRSRSGWTRASVLRILSQSTYTGTLTYCADRAGASKEGRPAPVYIPIEVPILVDQCLWDKAKDLRACRNPRPESSR